MLSVSEKYLKKIQDQFESIKSDGLVAKYLESRKIKKSTYEDVRALGEIESLYFTDPKSKKKISKTALIGRLKSRPDQKFNSVQRIFLEKNEVTGEFEKIKMCSGPHKGNYILIAKDDESLTKVGVAEGIATALAVRQFSRLPVLCGISSGNLPNVQFPDEVKEVHIFADNDKSKAGIKSATKLCNKLKKILIKSYIIETPLIKPGQKSVDWADVIEDRGDEEALKYYEGILDQQINNETTPPKDITAYSVAQILIEKLDKNYPGTLMMMYKKEGWFIRSKSNVFEIITEKEFQNVVTSLMQDLSVFPEKITNNFIRNVVTNLRSMCDGQDIRLPSIKDSKVNLKHWVFVKNGVVDMFSKKPSLIDVKSEDIYTTYMMPVSYDEKAAAPTWLNFLEEISMGDNAIALVLQEFFGFSLGSDYDFHKFMFIFGKGRNGKGVITTVLSALMGADVISTLSIEDLSERFRLANLVKSKVNVTNEGSFRKPLNEGVFKDLSSGGTITVERKFEAPFDMRNTSKFVITSNEYLKFRDKSDASWARAIVVPLEFQVLDSKKQNPNLSNVDWWKESGELSGVLNWAIEGRRRLYKNKAFTKVKSAEAFLGECKKLSNVERAFIRENFIGSPKSKISTAEMFKAYCDFCEEGKFQTKNIAQFAQEIRNVFPDAESCNVYPSGTRIRGWRGIARA